MIAQETLITVQIRKETLLNIHVHVQCTLLYVHFLEYN